MTRAVLPPMPRPPEGATAEDRERMYQEYCAELDRLNPHLRSSSRRLIVGVGIVMLIIASLVALNQLP